MGSRYPNIDLNVCVAVNYPDQKVAYIYNLNTFLSFNIPKKMCVTNKAFSVLQSNGIIKLSININYFSMPSSLVVLFKTWMWW